MAEKETEVRRLLDEVAEKHHQVFRITDGADEDWALWYADWLARLSELPKVLGRKLGRSELVYLLVGLDRDYASKKPAEPWDAYYARALVRHFAGA
jgi:hypothetical protein